MMQKMIIWAVSPINGPDNRGFTLVELMVAMAISSMITASIYMAYTTQQRMYTTQNAVVEMQQNIRAALLVMGDELRMAGYDPNQLGTVGITSASATTLTFTAVADNDGLDNDNADGDNDSSTGADEPGELKTVAYDLYDAYNDGINDIGRKVGNGNKRALAENIENIEFLYILDDNSQTLTPPNLKKIRSVRISILARSVRQDRDSINTTVYTAGSGAPWSYNDRIRRRLLVETINCRNLGL
jgi:type IV pilus assembly protein PilW